MAPEAPLEPRPAGAPGRAVLSLAAFAAVAAALVGAAFLLTRDPIADHEARRALAQLDAVLPRELYDNNPYADRILLAVDGPGRELQPVYRARRGGVPVAAVLTTLQRDGYSGPIRLLVGIRTDGTVLGARAVAHAETPGIGDFVDGRSSPWMEVFRGRSLADPGAARWTVARDGGDFDQVAGATITSRAAVAAVRNAVQYFGQHQDEIFGGPGTP